MEFRKRFSPPTNIEGIALHLSWCARPLGQAGNRGLQKLFVDLRWEIRTHPWGKEKTHGAQR
jgi:hypothetical protein